MPAPRARVASRARTDQVDVRGRPCNKGDDLLCDICCVNPRDVKGLRNLKLLIFPCLHSDRMCTQCVLRLKNDTLEKTYVPNFERQKEGATIRCPFCRKTCIAPKVVVKIVDEHGETFRRLGNSGHARALIAERRIAEKQYDEKRRGLITTAASAGVDAKHRFASSPRPLSIGSTSSSPKSTAGTGRARSSQSGMRRQTADCGRRREAGLRSRPDPLRPLPSVMDPNSVPKHMRRAAAALLNDHPRNDSSRSYPVGEYKPGAGAASPASAEGTRSVFWKPLAVPMLT